MMLQLSYTFVLICDSRKSTLRFTYAMHSPYNLILPSASPMEFLEIHLYPPRSPRWMFRTMSRIWTLYAELFISLMWYLSFDIIISPETNEFEIVLKIHCADFNQRLIGVSLIVVVDTGPVHTMQSLLKLGKCC